MLQCLLTFKFYIIIRKKTIIMNKKWSWRLVNNDKKNARKIQIIRPLLQETNADLFTYKSIKKT